MDGLTEVGPAKRSDAMRVVLAASEFGAYDSSQVKARAIGALAAAKINEWDEGLYGLARTYEQARTNLALPEIARLAADERLEAAYSKALDDLGVTDPATKKKMTWCAFQAAK